MRISSAIAQLRTTDLADQFAFIRQSWALTVEFQYEDFYAGIRAGQPALSPKTRGRTGPFD